MPDILEKRGPIEKSKKGWPINPFGVVALVIFGAIFILFIARPLLSQKTIVVQPEQGNASRSIALSNQNRAMLLEAKSPPLRQAISSKAKA